MSSIPWHSWLAFGEAFSRFAWLNWTFESTCLLACALGLIALSRLSAAMRHRLLVGCLLAASLAPATLSVVPAGHVLHTPSPLTSSAHGKRLLQSEALAKPLGPMPSTPQQMPALLLYPGLLLTGFWLLVVSTRLLVLAGASLWVARRRLGATPADRGLVYEACGYATAGIPILEADKVDIPMAAGVLNPCILLPRGMTARLASEELRHVLLHEASHVRRRDALWFCMAEVAQALLFWHPLAPFVRRYLVRAAEEACDAQVLHSGEAGLRYARTLLSVLERARSQPNRSSACPLGSAGADLRRRIVRILGGADCTTPLGITLAGSLVSASAATAFGLQLGLRPVLPTTYSASAQLAPVRVRVKLLPFPAGLTSEPQQQARLQQSPIAAAPISQRLATATRLPFGFEETAQALSVDTELAPSRELSPRDNRLVVFVMDASSGVEQFASAEREQILAGIEHLGPRDHFNVLVCDAEVHSFSEAPVVPGPDSRLAVADWLLRFPSEEGKSGESLRDGLNLAVATPDVSSVVLLAREFAAYNPNLLHAAIRRSPLHAPVTAYGFGPVDSLTPLQGNEPLPPRPSSTNTASEAPNDLHP